MDILIKQVELSDKDNILKLMNNSSIRDKSFVSKQITSDENNRYWHNFLNNGGNAYIAMYTNKVIGLVRLNNENIISIAVDDIYRGHGIGRQLLFKITSLKPIIAKIKKNNLASVFFFEKCGYIFDSEDLDCYTYIKHKL